MARYLIYGYKPIHVDYASDSFINSLCEMDFYKDGLTVSKIDGDTIEYFQLIRGSKLAQHLNEGSRYGYEQCVAYKIGKVAGERFARGMKTTFIKTKVDFKKLGNHATQKKVDANIYSGIYSILGDTKYLCYKLDGGFLFANTESLKELPYLLCEQTIEALINTYKQRTTAHELSRQHAM